MAELIGRAKMAMATLTSPGTATPLAASRPRRPIGNQHRKSDTAMVIKRRSMVMSWELFALSTVRTELAWIDRKITICPTAISRKRTKLVTIIMPKE